MRAENFCQQTEDRKHLLQNMPPTIKITICTVYKRLRTWTVVFLRGKKASVSDPVIQCNSEWNSETIIAHRAAKHQIFLIIRIKAKLINCVMFQRKMPLDLKYVVTAKTWPDPHFAAYQPQELCQVVGTLLYLRFYFYKIGIMIVSKLSDYFEVDIRKYREGTMLTHNAWPTALTIR